MKSAALQAKKGRGEPIVVLTCYDSPTAAWQEEAGVDVVFCADSVGTNLLGYDDERQVTMDDMIHHLKAVRRGLRGEAYLLADLPYGSSDHPPEAVDNSLRFTALGADGVKLEGFKPDVVAALAARDIEVWSHLGLNPQIHEAKRIKARTARAAARLVERSLRLEEAGASFLVLELIPKRWPAPLPNASRSPPSASPPDATRTARSWSSPTSSAYTNSTCATCAATPSSPASGPAASPPMSRMSASAAFRPPGRHGG